MAANLHKFLRKPSVLRIITSFKNPQSSNPCIPLLPHQPHFRETKSNDLDSLNPLWGTDKINTSQLFYPSFPFGYFLDPISVNGDNRLEDIADGGDDERTIWADSVKKKRKRKMNKHKYRKLRKRLRRKT